jgi:ribosomal protein S18 acetylase RimI-like enzyme
MWYFDGVQRSWRPSRSGSETVPHRVLCSTGCGYLLPIVLVGSAPNRISAGRSTPVIRPGTLADIPAVADLVMLHSGGARTDWEARLREGLIEPERCLLVAEEHRIVGYGRVHRFQAPPDAAVNVAPNGYYLSGLVVAATHRGRGIGAALTQARLSWIAERATEAWYFANARNQRSLRLHQRLGFEEITRDFVFPGVSFEGGVGVLSCATSLA